MAGIDAAADMPLPEKLKLVQSLMAAAITAPGRSTRRSGRTSGTAIAHFADFYDLQHVLVLGRVTSGTGGDMIVNGARAVLVEEFPELAEHIQIHVPDEQDKRHGQAIAAASLPALGV